MRKEQKSIRELGGEIWAELDAERRTEESVFSQLDHSTLDHLVDFIMSILARHVGTTIINDAGLEVAPRARTTTTDNST